MKRPRRADIRPFRTADGLRDWLKDHHATDAELWVGFYKKGVPKESIAYPEAVDEGLCFGWIDGITYRVDDELYTIRFTPRTRRSNWSAMNVRRVGELTAAGRILRDRGVSGADAEQDGDLLVREPPGRPAPGVPDTPPRREARLDVVAGADAQLSPGSHVVGHIGQAGSHSRPAPAAAHRRLRGWAADQAARR